MLNTLKALKERLSKTLNGPAEQIEFVLLDASAPVTLTAEEFYNQYNPEELQKGHCNIFGKIDLNGDAVCNFKLKDLAGCAGILMFHDLYVIKPLRKKGIGTALFEFVQAFAKHFGYAVVQGTDLKDNPATLKIFEKQGWTKGIEFNNPKTKNPVTLWQLKIE